MPHFSVRKISKKLVHNVDKHVTKPVVETIKPVTRPLKEWQKAAEAKLGTPITPTVTYTQNGTSVKA